MAISVLNGTEITHEGKRWTIVSTGVTNEGKIFAHLASTTEFRVQKNGKVPVQINDWIDIPNN